MNTIIKIPNYKVDFKLDVDYSYSHGKDEIKNLLIQTSKGYCMYCYSRILNDKKNYGHLEHTIEQEIVPELKECHQNLSIACPTCNNSFKKKEQNKRKIIISTIFDCNNKINNCQNYCQNYGQIATKYMQNMIENDLQKILLKPHIIINNDRPNTQFEIMYDLLDFKFKPSNNVNYSTLDKEYIQSHIDKFGLNDSSFETDVIREVLNDFFYYGKIPKEERYSNWIGDLFIEKLEKIKEKGGLESVKKFCNMLSLRVLGKK